MRESELTLTGYRELTACADNKLSYRGRESLYIRWTQSLFAMDEETSATDILQACSHFRPTTVHPPYVQ